MVKFLSKHKFFVIAIVGLCSFVTTIAVVDIRVGCRRYIRSLESLSQNLSKFISEHQGRFPQGDEEFRPYVSHENLLKSFSIRYGIGANELKLKQGYLYDLNDKPVLLIEGKEKNVWLSPWVSNEEKQCSIFLYEQMIKNSGADR